MLTGIAGHRNVRNRGALIDSLVNLKELRLTFSCRLHVCTTWTSRVQTTSTKPTCTKVRSDLYWLPFLVQGVHLLTVLQSSWSATWLLSSDPDNP